jgi:ribonuclease HI
MSEVTDAMEHVDEDGFLLAASDGSCPQQASLNSIRRTGGGLYYGKNHPANISTRVRSLAQNAQKSEVEMAVVWARLSWGKQRLVLDSQYVHKCVQKVILKRKFHPKAHRAAWATIKHAIHAKGAENFDTVHVNSHRKWEEVAGLPLRDQTLWKMNQEADALAVAAAETWQVPRATHNHLARERRICMAVQHMMVTIVMARSKKREEWGEVEWQKRGIAGFTACKLPES